MPVIDPRRFGVSFSLKQCNNFKVSQAETLHWLIDIAGFRRFRLMSYWDEHEPKAGKYNFAALDEQLDIIERAGGIVSLCLGVRQPRWPENHWPGWAWRLPKPERDKVLLRYIETVVKRYSGRACIISYQLENEALLTSFGTRPDTDRRRLRRELALVKRLDSVRPVIMTTSTSWGIPLRQPVPDIVGFSFYHIYYNGRKGRYQKAGGHYVILHRLRAALIRLIWQRPSFIHELQAEPWAPKAIWEVSSEEQDRSMGPAQIARSIHLGRATGLYPIDLWGAEWWYWRLKHGDASIWDAVRQSLTQ
jgi:hypothetical protein